MAVQDATWTCMTSNSCPANGIYSTRPHAYMYITYCTFYCMCFIGFKALPITQREST